MADFTTAFQWCMQSEDARMMCAAVPDASPAGFTGQCYAISGINSGVWPQQYAAIAALAQTARLSAVQDFYRQQYWNNWYAQLASDDVAKRVFDFSVNGGSGTAVQTLQKAVNALGGGLTVDGGWGPMTVAAVNAANQAALMQAFIAARVAHYMAIVAGNPADQKYLKNWLIRAQA